MKIYSHKGIEYKFTLGKNRNFIFVNIARQTKVKWKWWTKYIWSEERISNFEKWDSRDRSYVDTTNSKTPEEAMVKAHMIAVRDIDEIVTKTKLKRLVEDGCDFAEAKVRMENI